MVGKEPLSDQLSQREKEILERLSAGLTDQQIAAQLFLSPNTVKWYNRQIYSKLGVSNRTQAIKYARNFTVLSSSTSPYPQLTSQSHLPTPITPLIGRIREIEELKRLLQVNRLVTLTGTGGIGKTRLALRLASEFANAFANGIYFVDLAPLSDHTQVAKAISEAVGIIEDSAVPLLDTLKRVLNDQEALLLIDNFEHVIAAAPQVSDLLGTAPHLKVLITSRETLHLTGEQEYPVPPLSLPPVDGQSISDIMTSESVALFVQRARMTFPLFAIVDSNAPVVAQICARLDGLPLAIELAAALSKLLPPQALLERLDSRLIALTGGMRDVPMRQRTLRNTLEWSYNLLDKNERILFARLSVFRGGRSLEAIEAVCGYDFPAQLLESLTLLVDKNLIQQKEMPQGEPRFVMLETIHEYARERLIASGEAETISRRHALYFAELAERAEPELRRVHQKYWFQLLEMEIDNLRAALQWSLEGGDILCGVRIVSSTGLYWVIYGRQDEGIRWSQRLMARVDEVPLTDQAHLFRNTIYLTSYRDRGAAIWLGRQSIDMARKSGDKMQLAAALMMLSGILLGTAEMELLAQEALTLYLELDDKPGLAWVYNVFGEHARVSGDDEGAIRAYAESLAIAEQIGETRLQYTVLYNSAFVAQHRGDHREAVRLLRRSIAICRDMGVPTAPVALLSIAGSLGAAGEPLQAARLFGAAQAILQRKGMLVHPDDQPEHDRNITTVRAQLGEVVFAAAFIEGSEMTLDEALEAIPESLR